MGLELYRKKPDDSIITGGDKRIERLERMGRSRDELPRKAILTYWNRSAHYPEGLDFKPLNFYNAPDEGLWRRPHLIDDVLVIQGGCGGPPTAMNLEPYLLCGVKTVVGVGTAGSFQGSDYGCIGDLVLCDVALRGDGVSDKYLCDDCDYVEPDVELTCSFEDYLLETGVSLVKGPTYSTSAFYRTSLEEALFYRENGFAIEMEAATLFAMGESFGVRTASLFSVSDFLKEEWVFCSDHQTSRDAMKDCFLAALGFLRGL